MFYRISNAHQPKEIGKNYPQVSMMKNGYNYLRPNSTRNFKTNNTIPDLDGFQLLKGSKITNVISEGRMNGRAILIDKYSLSVFKNFTFSKHKLFDAKVYEFNGKIPMKFSLYYFAFEADKLRRDLNLEKSKFYFVDHNKDDQEFDLDLKGVTLQDLKDISIQKDNDILNLESGQNLRARKMYIRKEQAYDIFDIPILELSGRYCNEEVKQKIEESGITGLRFEEVKWLEYA